MDIFVDMLLITSYNWIAMDKTGQIAVKNGRWPRIEHALGMFYAGLYGSMNKAIEATKGLSASSFYQYRDEHPEEFAALEAQVQALAIAERRGIELAFAREQLERSMVAQRSASEAVIELLPELLRIASGEPGSVVTGDSGKEVEKTIIPYPRDQLKAADLLRQLAQDGLLAERGRALSIAQASTKEPEAAPEPERPVLNLPGLVASDFKEITATSADGSVVRASVVSPTEVIDIEPEQ